MPGRLDQAHARANGVLQRRAAQLAELVAGGLPVNIAGQRLKLTKGETASTWRKIKRELGDQAV